MVRSTLGGWGRGLVGDVRYVFRVLAASPAYVTVAVLSLAIGIGANLAMYAVMRAVLYEELPVTRPSELRFVQWTQSKGRQQQATNFNSSGNDRYSYPAFQALTAAAAGRAPFFGFNFVRELNVTLSDQPAVAANGMIVSGEYFGTLGLPVALGRPLGASDDTPAAPHVVVISDGLWRRLFGADPSAVGRTIRINRAPFEVVGVTPPAYRGLSIGGFFPATDVTVPIAA